MWFPSCSTTNKDQLSSAKNFDWEEYALEKSYLDWNVENLREWFGKRSYPEQLIKRQVARALQPASNNSDNNSKQLKEVGVPLVTTYHSRIRDLNSLIKVSLQYLYADQDVKKVFTPVPFVSFRSARNLKSYLVKLKVYPSDKKIRFWKM